MNTQIAIQESDLELIVSEKTLVVLLPTQSKSEIW
mgnify:CR=1 FL=1